MRSAGFDVLSPVLVKFSGGFPLNFSKARDISGTERNFPEHFNAEQGRIRSNPLQNGAAARCLLPLFPPFPRPCLCSQSRCLLLAASVVILKLDVHTIDV